MNQFNSWSSDKPLISARNSLTNLVTGDLGEEIFPVAFGKSFDVDAAIAWLKTEASNNYLNFPEVKTVAASQINYANGAYAADTNTIYLAREFVVENASDLEKIEDVILEEYGHFLDAQFSDIDAPGDEGNLFAGLVRQKTFTDAEIAEIKQEDDRQTVAIDNRLLEIEQATAGINPAFDLIGLTKLRNDPQFKNIDGNGFSVAVIDTGIDTDHSLLAPNYVAGFDFVDNDANPKDVNGHGTQVAGIVGAADENIGVAPGVDLIGLRVIDSNDGSISEVEAALEWVYENRDTYNITAVNLSLGLGFYTSKSEIEGDVLSDDIERLESVGVTIVGAAGNNYFANAEESNRENIAFPAIASTLAVGAVWQDNRRKNINWQSGSIDYTTDADRIGSFSQRLNSPNMVFAPGALVTSTELGGGIGLSGGTSQAAPHVAGAVALIQEASLEFSGRLLTPAEISDILILTGDSVFDGDDEDDNVINTEQAYVRINIYEAISEVKARADNLAPPDKGSNNTAPGDSNGTIVGAFVGPTIDGTPVTPLVGTIGRDGSNFRKKDVDVYSFEVVSPGTVEIEVKTDGEDTADFDSYLRLFDAEGNEIASNDNIAVANSFSRINATLEPGTYYAGVSGASNFDYDPNVAGSGIAGATGNYTLDFSFDNLDPNGLISGAQAFNFGSDLEPYVFFGEIGIDNGEAVGLSDVDLLEVVAPDNGELFIDLDTPFEDDFVDSYVRVFDADGNELLGANDLPVLSDDDLAVNKNGVALEFVAEDDSELILENRQQTKLVSGKFDVDGNYQQGNYGHDSDSFVSVRVQRGQTYYVGISDASNQDYNPNSLDNRPENTSGGKYELTTTFLNNDLNGSITQIEKATSLPINNLTRVIGRDGKRQVGDRDVDFYKINSDSAGILEIDVTSSAKDPVDTVASIFDGEGKRLGLNDGIDSEDSLLRYQIAPDTDYYVAIAGVGNQNFNPFALGSGTGGDTGTYNITGNLIPLQEAGDLADNTIGSSAVQNILAGETLLGNIGNDSGFVIGDTDVDLYRFVSDRDRTITIETIATEEFSADTYLRVFDRNGNEIAANDDRNDINQGSLIELEVTAGTEYYIGVSGSSLEEQQYNPVTGSATASGSQGNYTLSISSDNNSPQASSTIYRFLRSDLGTYFYTASEAERDAIIDNQPQYTYEGSDFVDSSTADFITGSKPVHRFYNDSTRTHLYTISETEKDSIERNLANYTYEGIASQSYESDRLGSTSLYRLYNPVTDAHLYTPSAQERDNIIANFPDYQLEGDDGIAFYVEPIGEL